MTKIRTEGLKTLGGQKVLKIRDIQESKSFDPENPAVTENVDLPKSDVLQLFLDSGTTVSARPSGTEPKIKFYINAATDSKQGLAKAKEISAANCDAITADITKILDAASK